MLTFVYLGPIIPCLTSRFYATKDRISEKKYKHGKLVRPNDYVIDVNKKELNNLGYGLTNTRSWAQITPNLCIVFETLSVS